MKKILTIMGVLFLTHATAVHAQTFITSHAADGDSSTANGGGILTIYNNVKATGSPVVLKWNVVGNSANVSTAATQWGLDGICDNVTCYAGGNLLAGGMHTTDPYNSAAFGVFYVLLSGTNASNGSVAWIQISAKDTATGGTVRILTFIGTKNASGVVRMTGDEAINFFPNPAGDNIIISTGINNSVRMLTIFSMDGKQIVSQKVTDRVSTVLLSQLIPGEYFIKLSDEGGSIIATHRFVHN